MGTAREPMGVVLPMRGRRWAATWLVTVLTLLTAACGGGDGNGFPDPDPGPVLVITEADLTDAGVPDPAELAGPLAATLTAGLAGDYSQDGVVDGADFVVWRGVVPIDGGGGFVTAVPPEDANRRIVAWAIYALPTEAAAHLTWLEADFDLDAGGAPLFFAVANAGTGRWEIGGRIDDSSLAVGHWAQDGTVDAPGAPSFRRSFSMSQAYVWPDGGTWVLVAVGNPGGAQADGVTSNLDVWGWSAIRGGIEAEYDLSVDGSCAWSSVAGGGGGLFNDWNLFHYIEQGNLHRQDFRAGHTAGDPRLLFAQPMDIRLGAGGLGPVTAHSVVDTSDFQVWRAGFFDPGEMNGWRHPFTLHVGDGPTDDLNVAPLLELDPTGTTRGIIGILVGLRGPVEGGRVDLVTAGDTITLTTGKAGTVVIPEPGEGAHELRVSYQDLDGAMVNLTYQLLVDTTSGTWRFR